MRFTQTNILLGLLLAGGAATDALAQQSGAQRPIIIIGQRPLFGVPPERTLGEDDISAYGVGTIGELLDEVAAENGETPDEPVILVNGEPVTGFADVAELPPEVVDQIEVLPRGSGTRVGASATRRVYNVVLKRNASTAVARAALRTATEGGWGGRRGDVSYTNVSGSRRLNGAVRLRDEGALLESERDIEQPPDAPDDVGRFRTLQPSLTSYQLNLTAADRLAPWLSGTLTGRLGNSRRTSLLGLADDDDPLRRRSRTLTGESNLSLNATFGSWLVSLLGTYDYDRRRTVTNRIDGVSRTTARTISANADLTAAGPIFSLPAGPLRLTLGAGLGRDSITGVHESDGDETRDRFVQSTRSGSLGLEIPLASRNAKALAALGELTASIQLTRTHVSDFGSLSNQTYALTWQPAEWLRLFGSVTTGRTPPAVAFLADPLLETPGVRYFDPLRDETVDVTEISGGNPDLEASRAANRRLSANIKPFKSLPLQFTAEYSAIRNRDIVTALPPASELILAAFPERFVRDAVTGVLTRVDVRPVQFARETSEQLRYGLNLSLPLGGSRPAAAPASETPRPGDDDDRPPAPARASSARPRLQLNFSHTWTLDSELVIREGLDPVDLLSRSAIGIGGATRPRHQLDFSLGYAERGLGARVTGRHRGESFLRLVDAGDTDVLRFAPLTTFGLRAWAEPSRFAPQVGWLKRSRLTVSLANIFNRRQRIADSAGLTPLAYQPDYRDPLGRTIEFEFRKAF